MLELTTATCKQLHDSLAKAEKPTQEGKCFRIVPKDRRFLTLTLARPAASDTVFTHDGDVILALPRRLAPFFENKSLDIDAKGKLTLN